MGITAGVHQKSIHKRAARTKQKAPKAFCLQGPGRSAAAYNFRLSIIALRASAMAERGLSSHLG